jgi:hypothetical protein
VRRFAPVLVLVFVIGLAPEAQASGYANAVLADHPQLYWRLGEGSSSSTAVDRVGQSSGVYLSWDPSGDAAHPRTSSPVSSALPADPDGAQAFPPNTFVESPPLPAFDTGAIEFWLRWTAGYPPGFANMFWRSAAPAPTTGYWSVRGGEDYVGAPAGAIDTVIKVGNTVYNNSWFSSDPAWHHYVLRWNASTIEQWRDGVLVIQNNNCCLASSPEGERIRIGNVSYDGRTDTGAAWELDEFATYSDLPPARIAAHYDARNAPTNLTAPSISAPTDGSGPIYRHDTPLTGADGTWTGGSLTYIRRWLRCRSDGSLCVEITGANGGTYTPGSADIGATLRLRVAARNAYGDDTAESAATPVIKPLKPEPQIPPAVSGPTDAHDGDALTSNNGTWGGDPADYVAFQWFRCDAQGSECVALGEQMSSQYRVGAADVDHTLKVQATAVNASGSASQLSQATAVIRAIPVAKVRRPTLSGIGRVGEVLSGEDGEWSGSAPRLMRNWLRCAASCAPIPGAADSRYAVTGQDAGFTLRYQVTASNSANSVTEISDPVGPIVGAGEPVPASAGTSALDPVSIASLTDQGPENGRNLAGAPTLSLQFTTNQRAVDTIPFGQTAYAGGRLVNERGEPIADAGIALDERSAAGGDFHRLAEVVTDHDGNYRTQIAPGPSRIVRASYRSHRFDRDPSATAQVELAVAASGLLQAQRARLVLGDQAVFRGRLAGEPFPASGIPITLEAKDGPRWAQVARGRTSRDGVFAFRYRFCKTIHTYTYGFRVSIGQTAGWPYDPGATNQVRVQVKVPKRVTKTTMRRCR